CTLFMRPIRVLRSAVNRQRVHSGLGGRLPDSEEATTLLKLDSYRWQQHCRRLYETPRPRDFSNSPMTGVLDFFKRQNFLPLNPSIFIEGHAIRTSEVTPICYRNPKVAHWPFEEVHGVSIADQEHYQSALVALEHKTI